MHQKRGKRDFDANRRRWPRFSPADIPSLKGVTSTTGTEIEVVNISRGGALFESHARLAPGTRIMLKIMTTEGVIQIAGQVLRSYISSLKGIPKYQSAVEFEQPLYLLDELSEPIDMTPQPTAMDSGLSEGLPPEVGPSLAKDDSSSQGSSKTILSVSAYELDSAALDEMLRLNEW